MNTPYNKDNLWRQILINSVIIILLFLVWVIVYLHPVLDRTAMPFRFDWYHLISAAILIVLIDLLCRLGEKVEKYKNQDRENKNITGFLFKYLTYFCSLVLAFYAFKGILVPYFGEYQWIYVTMFLLAAVYWFGSMINQLFKLTSENKEPTAKLQVNSSLDKIEPTQKDQKKSLSDRKKAKNSEVIELKYAPSIHVFENNPSSGKQANDLNINESAGEKSEDISKDKTELILRNFPETLEDAETDAHTGDDHIEDSVQEDPLLKEILFSGDKMGLNEVVTDSDDNQDNQEHTENYFSEKISDFQELPPEEVQQENITLYETADNINKEPKVDEAVNSETIKCNSCGAELKYGTIFCNQCFGQ